MAGTEPSEGEYYLRIGHNTDLRWASHRTLNPTYLGMKPETYSYVIMRWGYRRERRGGVIEEVKLKRRAMIILTWAAS